MLTCFECGSQLTRTDKGYSCSCGKTYALKEGIYDFLTRREDNADFPEDAFQRLYETESRSFWFRARNTLIEDALKRYLPTGSRLMEVGCGTGYVSGRLKRLGYGVTCGDVSWVGLKYCMSRNSGDSYYRFDISDKLFTEEFDAVCAFDVIEHMEDDIVALKNMHAALKSGGILILTAPASKRLWSALDEGIGHKRRYSAKELKEKIDSAGFKVLKLSYFMSFLYPFVAFSRACVRENHPSKGKEHAFEELRLNPMINWLFYIIFSMEAPLLSSMNLPFGSSLLCVAAKR